MWRDDVYGSCVLKDLNWWGKKEEWMFINIYIKIIVYGYFFFDWGSVIFIMVFVKKKF